MRWSGYSYIDDGCKRQSPPLVRPIAVALVAVALGGCTGLGLPFNQASVDRDLSTGSIQAVSDKGPAKVAQSDWDIVRSSIAKAATDKSSNGALEWRNPKTGTTGKVEILDTVTATNDPNCRNFQTTINDLRGVRYYRGEACNMARNKWQLFGVLAEDSKLL